MRPAQELAAKSQLITEFSPADGSQTQPKSGAKDFTESEQDGTYSRDDAPPLAGGLSFIPFVLSTTLACYFHFVSISSLRKVALAAKNRIRSTASSAPAMTSRLLVTPRSIRLNSPPT